MILSPQQIVSCDTSSDGCYGGDTTLAFEYVKSAGGIEPAKDYPYKSGDDRTRRCKADKSDFAVKISGYAFGPSLKPKSPTNIFTHLRAQCSFQETEWKKVYYRLDPKILS